MLAEIGHRPQRLGQERLARHREHRRDDRVSRDVRGTHLAVHHGFAGGGVVDHWAIPGERIARGMAYFPRRGNAAGRGLPPCLCTAALLDGWSAGRRGGVVTQRIANPSTPVRFRSSPPDLREQALRVPTRFRAKPAGIGKCRAQVGIGIIGCGNISGAYLDGRAALPGAGGPRGGRPRCGGGGGAGGGVRRAGGGCRSPRRRRDRDRAEPHDPRCARRGEPAGHRRRQARLFREAARHGLRRGRGAADEAESAGCASAARPTPSSAARTRRRGSWSTAGASARLSGAPPSSCAQGTSAGTRTRTSTTRGAAGRCSTWGPTTSPTSSTCWGPWRGSRRWRPPAAAAHHHQPPRAGETIEVEVPTHMAGSLEFRGAVVAVTLSFDVAGHRHLPLEITAPRPA